MNSTQQNQSRGEDRQQAEAMAHAGRQRASGSLRNIHCVLNVKRKGVSPRLLWWIIAHHTGEM